MGRWGGKYLRGTLEAAWWWCQRSDARATLASPGKEIFSRMAGCGANKKLQANNFSGQ